MTTSIELIDSPVFRKISKIVSTFSIIILICSALFSLHLLIKYKDYPEFRELKFSETQIWKYLQPEKYNLWLEYHRDYDTNVTMLSVALFLFFVSGLSIWTDNIRDPKRILSECELKLLRKIKKKILK